MAQGILRVLSDRPLALKLREKGFQRAASFTVKKQAEQTLRLYEELAGRF
jgi:glycosyltransferase involved in cell wall biosynthesis